MTLLSSPKVPQSNKLRLAILYALRYQRFQGNQIAQVVDALIHNGVSADRARLVYVMLNFAGADVRQDDLFMNENFFSRGKTALKGLKVSRVTSTGAERRMDSHNGAGVVLGTRRGEVKRQGLRRKTWDIADPVQGVENVYTQHSPHLSQTLDLLLKGRLKESSYPFLEGDEHARMQR